MEERREFPADAEGRLDCLTNVVNTEFKTLTLLSLGNQPMNGSDIRRTIRDVVGDVYLPKTNSFEGYCETTLFPIGVVAKDAYRGDGGVGYVLTEEGRTYGFPVAALVLDWAVMNNKSLYSVLGCTFSPSESRSPLNRIKILKTLENGESISEVELACKTGLIQSNFPHHLKTLCSEGLIGYSPINNSGRQRISTFLNQEIPSSLNGNSAKVLELLIENPNLSGMEIAKRIGITSSAVSYHMRTLLKKEVISYDLKKGNAQIQIKPLGKSFLDSFVHQAEDIVLGRDALRRGEELYQDITSDTELKVGYWKKALELYRKVSPCVNRSSRPREEIISYLERNPSSRHVEITKALGKKCVNLDLKKLLGSGKIVKDEKSRYSLA